MFCSVSNSFFLCCVLRFVFRSRVVVHCISLISTRRVEDARSERLNIPINLQQRRMDLLLDTKPSRLHFVTLSISSSLFSHACSLAPPVRCRHDLTTRGNSQVHSIRRRAAPPFPPAILLHSGTSFGLTIPFRRT